MNVIDIEKLKQLISRTDINGNDKVRWLTDFIDGREFEQQERSYSEEDMEIVEISSIDANYIPHYQTKEGQFLATKFNVKKFKKK